MLDVFFQTARRRVPARARGARRQCEGLTQPVGLRRRHRVCAAAGHLAVVPARGRHRQRSTEIRVLYLFESMVHYYYTLSSSATALTAAISAVVRSAFSATCSILGTWPAI